MTVRCEQCGHENDAQYHFCGMCGSPLRPAAASAGTRPGTTPPTASVPSFLGLGDDTKRDVNYLLQDDEEPSSHKGLYIVVVLLLVLGGGGAWYWWNGTWPWEARGGVGSAANSPPTTRRPATATPSVEPGSSPEASGNTATVAPPAGGSPAPAPAPPASEKPEEVPAPAASASETVSEGKAAGQTTAAPDNAGSATSTASEAPSAAPAPTEKIKAAPAPKVQSPKARPAVVPPNPGDKLVSDGEKYLYGRGVPQNCDRAQKNLLAAARQENPKAYTLLGAMYATGHCVTRDLPSAYRWFARALHQDPGNARLQQNLEVIWKQMTPEERKAATRGE